MRYASLFVLLGLIPNIACAAAPGNDIKYNWSLAALGDTINMYYRDYTGGTGPNGHEVLALGMLTSVGTLLKANPARTRKEIVDNCTTAHMAMLKSGLYCNRESGCLRNDKKYVYGQAVVAAKEECEAFVEDLNKKNKDYATNIFSRPGTYVKKTAKCGGSAYEVIDVVPGKDTDNQIYLVGANGSVEEWKGYTTQTNGTFIDETAQTKGVAAGQIRGVYKGSYILPVDVTSKIYEMYNNDRGTLGYSMKALVRLNDWGDYDVKRIWTKKTCDLTNFGFRVTGQGTDAKQDLAHTNGVIFKGHIVTLENLGHILTGMIQADSLAPDDSVDYAAEALQGINANDGITKVGPKIAVAAAKGAVTLGAPVPGALVGAAKAVPLAKESPYANGIRYDAKDDTGQEKDDVTFSKTKTSKNQDAYNMARRHMAKKYGLERDKIKCSGKCNTNVPDDFVTCYYDNGSASKVVVYKFDSICRIF